MTSSISIKNKLFLKISIWSIDGTLTGIINWGQSEPRSNSNEGVLHAIQDSEM